MRLCPSESRGLSVIGIASLSARQSSTQGNSKKVIRHSLEMGRSSVLTGIRDFANQPNFVQPRFALLLRRSQDSLEKKLSVISSVLVLFSAIHRLERL